LRHWQWRAHAILTAALGAVSFHPLPAAKHILSSSMAITIRPATPKDLSTLGRLGALLVRTHHDFDPKRFMAATQQTESGYASFLGTQLDAPNVVVLVAEQDGDVVGYTYAGVEGRDYMSLRGPAGVLYDIVVDPERRRNGVGRTLLQATLQALKSHGAPQVVLSTAVHNEAAQRLFESAGFRRTMIEMTAELKD
jgi:ribosomal protein S18 acetylase RimI-like enzyme